MPGLPARGATFLIGGRSLHWRITDQLCFSDLDFSRSSLKSEQSEPLTPGKTADSMTAFAAYAKWSKK